VQNSGGGGGGTGSTPSKEGGAGGSGIVIVKELNKASGSWPLRAQFSSQKQGTWPDGTVNWSDAVFDYLVVAGGGAGGAGPCGAGGGGAGGYRTSFPGGTKLVLDGGTYPITIGAGGEELLSHGAGSFIFQQLHQQVVEEQNASNQHQQIQEVQEVEVHLR
jgi:hypothetical protein